MTTELYHIICEWLRDVIAKTQWEGHVFAVGGCCRDEIMGFEIQDIDLAVDIPNGGVAFARWLHKRHFTVAYPTIFAKYGTAKLRLRRFPEEEIELVQTRREQYTKETSRNPAVVFGSIKDDCFRRDFTVNSLYYDITNRQMVDITGRGIADMNAGILRTPLDPDETFNDDPVRILRGLRFANRFNWQIDPDVFAAMLRHIHRIDIVSRERCHSELCKMLNGPDPVAMLQTLRQTGVLQQMIPQLADVCNDKRRWQAVINRLSSLLARDPQAPTRFRLAAILLGLSANSADAAKLSRQIMTELRFDRPIVADVVYLVRHVSITGEDVENPRFVRAMQNLAGEPRRLEFFLRWMRDLGCHDVAEKLAATSRKLVADRKTGFTAAASNDARRRRRRRRRSGTRRRAKNHF